MKNKMKILTALITAGLMSLSLNSLAAITFTIDTANGGEAAATANTFDADKATGFYNAEVDQDIFGSFTESGLIDFAAWGLGDDILSSAATGLNEDYNMYGLFTAAGVASIVANTVQVTFSSFLAEIWVDPDFDTTTSFVAVNEGADQDGFRGQDASSLFGQAAAGTQAHTLANTGDDVLALEIVAGDFKSGMAIVCCLPAGGFVEGAFDVRSFFNTDIGAAGSADDFFQFAGGFLELAMHTTGQTGTETGIFSFPATDALFQNASANIEFIPEPGTLVLFSLGLFGLAAISRRRRML